MASKTNKKIVVFYVLEVLKEFSDENHLLTYADIRDKIEKLHDVCPDVKSIANNISILIEAGYDIIKCGYKGCYLDYRGFNNGELLYLVDAIISSNYISSNQAKELIERLTKDCSKFDKTKYKYLQKINTRIKRKNNELFYVIEILADAIAENKQVAFNYNEFKLSKDMEQRVMGKEFIINPYNLVNSRGKYYLVCNYDKYDDLSNYRIDCISNIRILDTPRKPLKNLAGGENFLIKNYVNEHIYMTNGKSEEVVLKVDNQKYVNEIVDWFGDSVEFKLDGNNIYAKMKVNEDAVVFWALQYGQFRQLRHEKKIRSLIEFLMEKYK